MQARKPGKVTRVALYGRCSTRDQDVEVQMRELRAFAKRRSWSVVGEYVDEGVSGSKDRRPALDRLMLEARRGAVDVIAVWALDRWGRSLRHLVASIDELSSLGVGFTAFTQGIDTSQASPSSTLQLQVLASVAQFERSMIQARVLAGMRRARARGKRIGRPRAQLNLHAARERLAQGESMRAVARFLKTNPRTLRRALAREEGEAKAGASEARDAPALTTT